MIGSEITVFLLINEQRVNEVCRFSSIEYVNVIDPRGGPDIKFGDRIFEAGWMAGTVVPLENRTRCVSPYNKQVSRLNERSIGVGADIRHIQWVIQRGSVWNPHE